MKNILLVGNWSSDTGYAWWLMETFWIAIAKKYCHQSRVIVCYPQVTTIPPRLALEGVEVVEFKLDSKDPVGMFKFLRANNIGMVYLTDRSYFGPLYFWLRIAGVKHIILHDHTPGVRSIPGPLKGMLKRLLSSIPALTADAYIAVSEQIYERLQLVVCLPRDKCHIAKNGIDTERFLSAKPSSIRTDIHIPSDAVLVISSGRLTSYKGVQTIIEAASILANHHNRSNVFFIHAGDGPERNLFDDLVKERSLQGRFFLLGMRADVPQLLKAADIAVHASQGEGLSLSILEFMCAGLPVIVSDEPSVCQSVEDGVTGIHFKVGDAKDLAAKLNILVVSQSARQRLGNSGSKNVVENYSLDKTVRSLLGVFDHLINDMQKSS